MNSSYRALLKELQETATRTGLPLETVEQDYAISYLLTALSQTPELSEALVFRGGTALRKCYFKDYRYSNDLDYSVQGFLPADKYNQILAGVADTTRDLLSTHHAPNRFHVVVKLVVSRAQHDDNQDTHKFVVRFPWHLKHTAGRAGRTIKLDTSHSEPVLLKPEMRNLIHQYSHALSVPVKCAALEEIVAEKYVAMCAVAAQRERQERTSTRPRDYFDVRYALSQEAFASPMDCLAAMLVKAERRGIEIRSINDLVSHSSRPALERDWKPFLGDVVPNLPSCDTTLKELEQKLQELFPDMASSIEASRERASQLKRNLPL